MDLQPASYDRKQLPQEVLHAPTAFGCIPRNYPDYLSQVGTEGILNQDCVSWRQYPRPAYFEERWRGSVGGSSHRSHIGASQDNFYPRVNYTVYRSYYRRAPVKRISENDKISYRYSSSSSDSSDGYPRKQFRMPRNKSPILPLRTFNNWAKARIIQEAIPDNLKETVAVMDLGCGKGVDLKKWAHSKVHHVYLVEDNEQDMEECQKRFIEINRRWPERFKATFINKDFTFDSIMLPEKIQVVSCQFFVQRAFSTESESKTFAKNISSALKLGGFFIASLVNANKIKTLMGENDDQTRFSNGVFTIELEYPLSHECPEFGLKMLFLVDDKCFPENLVRLDTLTRVMKEADLELIWHRSFSDLYEEAKSSNEQKNLLEAMGVCEEGKLLMTKAQMETAYLYEAVMFQKKAPTGNTIATNELRDSASEA